MLVVVGLGNPGDTYRNNRHNIGFMAVDEIHRHFSFGPWSKKFQALVAEAVVASEKVLLVKPQTYMNLSGQSVGEIIRFYKVASEDVVVIHDELSLPPGKIKAKIGGGAAGHNGLKSLDSHITPHYVRVRIGIGHPGNKDQVSDYVLSNFSGSDKAWVEETCDNIARALPDFMNDGLEAFTKKLGVPRN